MRRFLVGLAFVLLALLVAPAASSGERIAANDYDLGVREFVQPNAPPKFEKMPIRLWGTIAVPAGKGPFPLVLVGHGVGGTGCELRPPPDESEMWPCWSTERRSDLGFRHLVRALARGGFAAIAPDFNAAFTDGWGEPREDFRYRQVLEAMLSALATANKGGENHFGVPLAGKLDLSRIGMTGHSRGGAQALEWAWARRNATSPAQVAAGQGRLSALLLLAPPNTRVSGMADIPLTVALGSCDGDTGVRGEGYFQNARNDPRREAPTFKTLLYGANHRFYNQVLAADRGDDGVSVDKPSCKSGRPSLPEQQAWAQKLAVDVFRQGFGLETASWMRRGAPFPTELYGWKVGLSRFYPRK